MASGISSATIAGNIVADPDLRSDRLLTFAVAVNRREKEQNSENWIDVAHFFEVKVLGARAAGLASILVKGDKVTVLGDLVQERWDDKETGKGRSAVRILAREVVLGGGKRDDAEPRDDAKDLF